MLLYCACLCVSGALLHSLSSLWLFFDIRPLNLISQKPWPLPLHLFLNVLLKPQTEELPMEHPHPCSKLQTNWHWIEPMRLNNNQDQPHPKLKKLTGLRRVHLDRCCRPDHLTLSPHVSVSNIGVVMAINANFILTFFVGGVFHFSLEPLMVVILTQQILTQLMQ